ncbi:hypothetical protein PF006_g17087 [Phytophthora fragariae]|uniref:Uncharacterized protein n=1 Tax=Phytophthora fragariae TaxID=53985 RepID=A0A6A3SWH9_9STRA|nr:hypothetical protein PF003_g19103 [Phytophthora fragariae]KAE9124867.1 hypothetical protein PF006_g17087 [Phytophthora fragariae]
MAFMAASSNGNSVFAFVFLEPAESRVMRPRPLYLWYNVFYVTHTGWTEGPYLDGR